MKIREMFKSTSGHRIDSNTRNETDSNDAIIENGFTPIAQTQEEDIFVVGFPKSGNTWMQNLIAGLLFGIDTNYLPDKLTQLLVPNVHGCKFYKRLGDLTCFKSHFLPRPEYRRVVYLVRDGRDAMVSYYHMNKAVLKTPVSMQEMIVTGKDVFPCKWHEHVEKWNKNPYDAEIIFVRYEDLHVQPVAELEKFCQFAGLDRPTSVLKKSIAGNRFDQMQAKEDLFGWNNDDWNSEDKFIRKGQVGGFRKEMPEELIKAFDRESRQQLSEFGYLLNR